MTGNDDDTATVRVAQTATGALDHAAIEARARQLRRETLSALTDDLVRWLARAWAVTTRRQSPDTGTHGHTAAGNCADH